MRCGRSGVRGALSTWVREALEVPALKGRALTLQLSRSAFQTAALVAQIGADAAENLAALKDPARLLYHILSNSA